MISSGVVQACTHEGRDPEKTRCLVGLANLREEDLQLLNVLTPALESLV